MQSVLNQTLLISGTSAEGAAAAILQLAQGLAAGALQGDELRSQLENNPRLIQALTDQLGINIAELRDLGAEGGLTVQVVLDALLGQAQRIDNEFSQLSTTVGQAFEQLRTSILVAVGATQEGTDSTNSLVQGVRRLQEIVESEGFRRSMSTAVDAFVSGTEFLIQNLGRIIDLSVFFLQIWAASAIGRIIGVVGRFASGIVQVGRNLAQVSSAGQGTIRIRLQLPGSGCRSSCFSSIARRSDRGHQFPDYVY